MTYQPRQSEDATTKPVAARPICPECETESWCRVHGCIPVTDPVDEELADAIADLCNVKDEA